jgi:AraC family transcriptional regulator of adaptative response / DNA-3-methyladenine glycosylase II
MLDFAECDRARIGRDRAYDGRFFTGVRPTGVLLPAGLPGEAGADAQCRVLPVGGGGRSRRIPAVPALSPGETAPFSPAWKGSLTTVERALRLVEAGALDEAGVEALADRLGIGARHLTRLFRKHLGASPSQVAKTARIQRAKRLIDGTDLPITEIALAAGFRSVRRFNAVFAEVYKRPPTAIRRSSV